MSETSAATGADATRPGPLPALFVNLVAGARLARGRPLAPGDFHASTGIALLTLGLAWAAFALAARINAGEAASFWVWGFIAEAARMHLWVAALALASWLCGAGRGLALLVVVQLSAGLPVWLFCTAIEILAQRYVPDIDTPWTTLYFGSAFLWYCTILWRSLVLLPHSRAWRRALAVGIYGAMLGAMHQWLPDSPLFYRAESEAPSLDIEGVYYQQDTLLDAALSALAPQTPGHTDLYYVGLAAYAEQDVFMREALAVQDIVTQRLGLVGRTVTLVNNPRTVDTLPLANRHNLVRVTEHLGRIMDRDDDVALIYLTSHGYEDSSVAVEFGALGLNDIYPEDINEALTRAGLRYAVIIVSACYSGGFVDALRSPDRIVITAAARDRASFGCGAERDWTYFGEAYFTEGLAHTTDFAQAFARAAASIAAREKREWKEASRPQLWVGREIEAHLRDWRPAPISPPVQPSESR